MDVSASLDEEDEEYFEAVMEGGNYDSKADAVRFAIRYAASEKYDQ